MGLGDKTVFITDIHGAFGRAVARAIARAGGRFVAGCTKVSGTPGEFSDRCIEFDPSESTQWPDALDRAEAMIGPLTSVVGNPDHLVQGSIEQLDLAGWRRAQACSLTASMLTMRNALPKIRHVAGSSIVNICSIASEIGLQNHVSYSATAFAIRPMTRSAAIHAREKGYATRVNCIVAGFDDQGPLAALIPEAAVAADDVAAMVVYLLSDSSQGSNGAEFTVDNGGSIFPT